MPERDPVRTTPSEIQVFIEGTPGMEALRQAPEVTHVYLDWAEVADDDLREIARLPDIRLLSVSGLRPDAGQFAILAKLPPGACVTIFNAQEDYPEWAAFRKQRIVQVARLDPKARRRAAERFAGGIDDRGRWHPGPSSLRIQYGSARDDDLRYLRWLPQLQDLEFSFAWGLTSASLRHLSRLKQLKSLSIHGMRFTTGSLQPLVGCVALERLSINPDLDVPAHDCHTVGLEQLKSLRQLELNIFSGGDATVERIGHLDGLRHLELTINGPADPGCLRALGQLQQLRTLHLVAGATGESLRHLAGLKELNELEILVAAGTADGLRHLAELRSLRHLRLTGWENVGGSLHHLEGLKRLRSLQVGIKGASVPATRRLAAAIPGLTIRRGMAVVRAPQPMARFHRVARDGFASALIPRRWKRSDRQDAARLTWIEVGFERFHSSWWCEGHEALPAQITLSIDDLPAATTARELLHERAIQPLLDPRLQELTAPGRCNLAFGTSYGQVGKSLIAIATSGRRAAVLDCAAPLKRFPKLLGLFRFVAASLEVGLDARAGEKVSVDARELA